MNKTAIKNFAIWARNKLIADITYKAGLLGITEKDIKSPLPQSSQTVQFFDIGTKEPSSITGYEIEQRKKLVEEIRRKAYQSNYSTAYKNVIEEVAYTWFNRLIAIRFMEVNDYLPSRIRVLSSESNGKAEPDLITHAMEAGLDYSAYEKDRIIQLKYENKLDELFRMLFIKQCNALNENLPELFEKTSDYSELLLNVSIIDKDGVVYHLVNDISEDDFNVSKEGQIEIIGWLYQYYNTEPKDETFALLKKNVKITKERIPAATQLFTPDWIVRYMVENSLGRLWLEGHPNDELKANWKYYLDEAKQEDDVQKQLDKIREEYKTIKPEDIKIIDPAMGSGHILVYAFDVLMQIYESYGYSQRDAAKSIVENNLYGLDIDNRAFQLAYFAVLMKARQYNRRILSSNTTWHVYAIHESNDINRNHLKYFGVGLSTMEKNTAILQMQSFLDTFTDAKEYGSIINVENYNWQLLRKFISVTDAEGQMSLNTIGIEHTRDQLHLIIELGEILSQTYDAVVTNPPYMGSSGMNTKLVEYVKKNYPDTKSDLFAVFIEKCTQMTSLNRYQAMITQHSWMFLSGFERLRNKLQQTDIVNMVHLGPRAFEEISGEVVQTTSFVIRRSSISRYKALYCRLTGPSTQKEKENLFLRGEARYLADQEDFLGIPGKRFAYWINAKQIFRHKSIAETFISGGRNKTHNNEKYVRCWWEPIHGNLIWKHYDNGGNSRKWYGNCIDVVDWSENAKNFYASHGGLIKDEVCEKYGISWNGISGKNYSFKIKPAQFVFSSSSPTIIGCELEKIYETIAALNSCVGPFVLDAINPTLQLNVGEVLQFPIVPLQDYKETVISIAQDNISLAKDDWNAFEISWDFTKHQLVRFTGEETNDIFDKTTLISVAYHNWKNICDKRFNMLKTNEEKLNHIFIKIFGLQKELTPEIENRDVTVRKADTKRDIRSLISYAVGCIFGRYSLDMNGIAFAGEQWDEKKYSTLIPNKDNILPITDEEYFSGDILGAFTDFIKKVYGAETIENNLDFIAEALSNNGNSSREIIRNYFMNDFFKDHCKIYHKRPIYWLFDSGKQNGFKALVYSHRYDENTIGNLRIDYLHRMQRIYENEIGRMQDTIENSKDSREISAAMKRKEKLIKQLQETKDYDEKIAHLALARISIDLDDGVKVNYEKIQTDTDGKKLDVLAKI